MPVIIDELTTTVEAPPPASASSTGASSGRGAEMDPMEVVRVEVVRVLNRLAERAARLSAD
jgi:hypothetical protein